MYQDYICIITANSLLLKKETDSEKYIYKTSISRGILSNCFQAAWREKQNGKNNFTVSALLALLSILLTPDNNDNLRDHLTHYYTGEAHEFVECICQRRRAPKLNVTPLETRDHDSDKHVAKYSAITCTNTKCGPSPSLYLSLSSSLIISLELFNT